VLTDDSGVSTVRESTDHDDLEEEQQLSPTVLSMSENRSCSDFDTITISRISNFTFVCPKIVSSPHYVRYRLI